MTSPPPLQLGAYYHIYNRGINRENVFREERTYRYFLELYAKHIEPVAGAYAYCLLKNHSHDPFGRILVETQSYLIQLVRYIHFNPQKHGFVNDFRQWPWSSYSTLVGQAATQLARDEVLGWFGGMAEFARFHNGQVDEAPIRAALEQGIRFFDHIVFNQME